MQSELIPPAVLDTDKLEVPEEVLVAGKTATRSYEDNVVVFLQQA